MSMASYHRPFSKGKKSKQGADACSASPIPVNGILCDMRMELLLQMKTHCGLSIDR